MSYATIGGWLHELWPGLKVTLQVSLWTTVASVCWSLVLALASISPSRTARMAATLYVDLFRSIPLLALLFFTYYGLGSITVSLHISALWLGIGGLVLSESAYLAEVYRSTFQAVPATQWEAGASLGLRWHQIVRHVVVPQFILPAIPTTLVMLIAVLKNSSLLSIIAINELTLTAESLIAETFKPLQIYLLLAAIYLAVTVPLGYLSRALERRFVDSPLPRRARRTAIADRSAVSWPEAERMGTDA
jgi:His/Glu/Gln/Arg/opine family amino acid ABC transporter permease subunit